MVRKLSTECAAHMPTFTTKRGLPGTTNFQNGCSMDTILPASDVHGALPLARDLKAIVCKEDSVLAFQTWTLMI